MDLQSLTNLIHLRRYLHDVQNGYAVISKDQLRGINAKLRELDTLIVKNALSANLTTQIVRTATSSDIDFEASTKYVLESRNVNSKVTVSQAGVEIESAGGITIAAAPPDKVEVTAPEEKPASKKRKPAFNRTDSE